MQKQTISKTISTTHWEGINSKPANGFESSGTAFLILSATHIKYNKLVPLEAIWRDFLSPASFRYSLGPSPTKRIDRK
ncbi:MAG: hypothetical protein C0614_04280 [Desulfuromonas sp.]|nr:MAG: hypothetical protein C0614_04280 [Desulfuromonas sp.]